MPPARDAAVSSAAEAAPRLQEEAQAKEEAHPAAEPPVADDPPPWDETPAEVSGRSEPELPPPVSTPEPRPTPVPEADIAPAAEAPAEASPSQTVAPVALDAADATSWPQIFLGLQVGGVVQNIAANCELVKREADHFYFVLDEDNSSLYGEAHQQRLADALSHYFQQPVQVTIELGRIDTETPAQIADRKRSERLAQAVEAVKSDPIVQQLIEYFSATLDEASVRPVDSQ